MTPYMQIRKSHADTLSKALAIPRKLKLKNVQKAFPNESQLNFFFGVSINKTVETVLSIYKGLQEHMDMFKQTLKGIRNFVRYVPMYEIPELDCFEHFPHFSELDYNLQITK